ncbi:MAG: glycosyltransferase [Spirochaetia bacterium]|nr:glycosyltransferase [Spirochaetia bacterium]
MNKKAIFHIPFAINEDWPSASQIRPQKMIEAFRDIGYDLKIVMGKAADRKKTINEIKKEIKMGKKYEFLYSESSTMPTLLTEWHHLPLHPFLDFSLFKLCKKNKIPVGLFYRDIYWMFDQYKKDVSLLKRMISILFYRYDLKKYRKFVNILFFPSNKMFKYIKNYPISRMYELPPGVIKDKFFYKKIKKNNIKLLYVGGIGGLYDISKILIAVSTMKNIKLYVCTRKMEWEVYKHKYRNYLCNVEIFHISGKELDNLYKKSDIALACFDEVEYRNFAMPMKLFEYLSYGKPIIASKNTAVGDFVKKYKIGWCIPYKENSIKKVLENILSKPTLITNYRNNSKKIIVDNTWISRAERVSQVLTSKLK